MRYKCCYLKCCRKSTIWVVPNWIPFLFLADVEEAKRRGTALFTFLQTSEYSKIKCNILYKSTNSRSTVEKHLFIQINIIENYLFSFFKSLSYNLFNFHEIIELLILLFNIRKLSTVLMWICFEERLTVKTKVVRTFFKLFSFEVLLLKILFMIISFEKVEYQKLVNYFLTLDILLCQFNFSSFCLY